MFPTHACELVTAVSLALYHAHGDQHRPCGVARHFFLCARTFEFIGVITKTNPRP